MSKLYLGGTAILDLTGYATTSYVDSEVLGVSSSLDNYVQKDGDKVLSDENFTTALKTKLEAITSYDDTSVVNAISAIRTTLADITTDGSIDSVINTFTEIKSFLSDYTTANDLGDIISNVETTVTSTVETWVGNQGYLKSNDISTFITASALADYATKNDISTFITASALADYATKNDISTFVTQNDASVYLEADDVSTNIKSTNQSVMTIITISQSDFTALQSKDPSTLYIVQ